MATPDADALREEGADREDRLAEHFSKLSEIIIAQWATGSCKMERADFPDEDSYEEFLILAGKYKYDIQDFIEDAGVEVGVAIYFRDYLRVK